jgi:hypothetical protein
MTQVEIDFFWTLTEQIPLDLDYTPCEEFYRKLSVTAYGTLNGNILTTNGNLTEAWHFAPVTTSYHIKTSPNYVGHWEVQGKDFQIYREKRPSWLHRKVNKILIGWVWKDDK